MRGPRLMCRNLDLLPQLSQLLGSCHLFKQGTHSSETKANQTRIGKYHSGQVGLCTPSLYLTELAASGWLEGTVPVSVTVLLL